MAWSQPPDTGDSLCMQSLLQSRWPCPQPGTRLDKKLPDSAWSPLRVGAQSSCQLSLHPCDWTQCFPSWAKAGLAGRDPSNGSCSGDSLLPWGKIPPWFTGCPACFPWGRADREGQGLSFHAPGMGRERRGEELLLELSSFILGVTPGSGGLCIRGVSGVWEGANTVLKLKQIEKHLWWAILSCSHTDLQE